VLAESHYSNTSYCAALSKGYIHAFQFHPERSAASGLKIYANLRKMICAGMERAELSCSD
jgi:imidazoleglycerol phosphate synthase glutamine amidotransferase subunit HisH